MFAHLTGPKRWLCPSLCSSPWQRAYCGSAGGGQQRRHYQHAGLPRVYTDFNLFLFRTVNHTFCWGGVGFHWVLSSIWSAVISQRHPIQFYVVLSYTLNRSVLGLKSLRDLSTYIALVVWNHVLSEIHHAVISCSIWIAWSLHLSCISQKAWESNFSFFFPRSVTGLIPSDPTLSGLLPSDPIRTLIDLLLYLTNSRISRYTTHIIHYFLRNLAYQCLWTSRH